MESVLSFDDSSDSDTKNLKNQLTEFGIGDESLSKEEMIDLLKALKNSKSTVKEDELLRQKVEASHPTLESISKLGMTRKYLNVRDRRMPWSILPNTITSAQKAHALAIYIKLLSINNYRQARQSVNFVAWPPPIQIFEESTRIQPLRSTRSGRNVPVYCGFDDDSSDFDISESKVKKRKISNSDHNTNGVYSNKVVSLKRKTTKDENTRPVKESKMDSNTNNGELVNSGKTK